MTSVLDRLDSHGLLARVPIDAPLRELLQAAEILPGSTAAGDVETGNVDFGFAGKPLGIFDLQLKTPLPKVPFRLQLEGGTPPTGFRFWLHLSDAEPAAPVFDFVEKLPGYGLAGAVVRLADDEEWLDPAGGPAELHGANLSLLVRGTDGQLADMILTPTQGGSEGIVALTLQPSAVLLGGTGFGLDLPDGIVLDSTHQARPPGTTEILGQAVSIAADDDGWMGIAARKARLFLPAGVPLLGRHAVETFLTIGEMPPGVDFAVATRVPAHDGRPEITVRIECRDPTASGLSGFVPTLVEASMVLPLDGREEAFSGAPGGSIKLLAGNPLIVRARLSREPGTASPVTRVALGVEAQGDRGILTIDASGGGLGERAAVAAGALVTALIADEKVLREPGPGGDQSGVYLHLLLTAAMGLSAFLRPLGKVVLYAVELEGEGAGLAVTEQIQLRLDYAVNAVVDTFRVGALSVGMLPEQPMKVRVRGVILTLDTTKSGLEMIHLGFDRASMELEDPGGWQVEGPGSLFDVLGTRSGRGSMWIEVDLRFKLDLGPVKVSGATIRATLGQDGRLSADLRGLAASLLIPGVIQGEGRVEIQASGFKAELDVSVIPLNVSADAFVQVDPPLVALGLGVDLPGPIPLANSGLGLYGLGGAFAASGKPAIPPGPDTIRRQLAWDYEEHGFEKAPASDTIGVEAIIATAPDLGFSFSSKAGIFLTIPEVAIRVGLSGKVISPRVRITDRPNEGAFGPSFRGVIVIDPNDGVTIGLVGEYKIPILLELKVPLGARFPKKTSDWYIYIGADGHRDQDRAMGPIRAVVLPDILGARADAFFMMRGKGIKEFGRGKEPVTLGKGFVLCFGFGFEFVLGVEGLIWAEIRASADIMVATSPLLLAGFGHVGGSLNLGPVSIGIDAQIEFVLAAEQDFYLFAQVCGRVDLFFFEIEGCVEIEVANPPTRVVPLPSEHPLDRKEGDQVIANVGLVDDTYRRIAALAESPDAAETVWPDAIVHLAFAVPPALAPGVAAQFPSVTSKYGARARPIGSDLLSYDWTVTRLELLDVTDDPMGAGVLVPGQLSAEWQVGKSGDVKESAEPAELMLLTPKDDLWLHRTADAGSGLAHDPLGALANICRWEARAREGWTLGWRSLANALGFALTPEILSSDPADSQIRGIARPGCSLMPGAFLNQYTAQELPTPFLFEPARSVMFTTEVLERPFEGYLQLPRVGWPPALERDALTRMEVRQTLEISLDDRLFEGRIWLTRRISDAFQASVSVTDNHGRSWPPAEEAELSRGLVATVYRVLHADGAVALSVVWEVGADVGLLGLGGTTETAITAAAARNKAAQAAADDLAKAKVNNPPKPGHPPKSELRTVLLPDRLYRVDVDLTWRGTLKFRDDRGTEKEITRDGPDPAPAIDPLRCNRSFWFRTAKLQEPAIGGDGSLIPLMLSMPKFGDGDVFAFKKRKRDLFHPAMLERYFLGYEPSQSEQARFADDPLRAHFSADHIAILAATYGFELKLGLQRIDTPGEEGRLELLIAAIEALSAPYLLDQVGRRIAEIARTSPCDLPHPGATLTAVKPLATEAWYELNVVAKSTDNEVLDGRLPGVTFRTSRWRGPHDMIDSIGFPPAGSGSRSGDFEWRDGGTLDPAVAEGDDAAFQAALAAIGIDGLPPPLQPRVSVIWRKPPGEGEAWLCAGILIQAPEPVHRPGRVEVVGLRTNDAAVQFDQRRRDRAGAEMLFVTGQSFQPPAVDPFLQLDLIDRATGATINGRLALPLQPDFAEDL